MATKEEKASVSLQETKRNVLTQINKIIEEIPNSFGRDAVEYGETVATLGNLYRALCEAEEVEQAVEKHKVLGKDEE